MIRSACDSDTEAIVSVEASSFPDVYPDAVGLAGYRRREFEEGYPCCKIIGASSIPGFGEEEHSHSAATASAVHGFVIFETYLHAAREYRDRITDEEIALPANRPPEKKPAYSILMAAIRADPALLEEEFIFVSEICIHPQERERGNGTKLMHHMLEMAEVLAVKVIVLVEGSVSDAARQWTTDEGEDADAVELAALRKKEQRTSMQFYEDKLGLQKRAYFFWGRQGSAIPRIFYVMQYPTDE
ncbi:hypothetical protein F4808DRAFT_454351 [Astrocystis sublimbata]|nr:hypothetical protein F4808DRAFT_454351 [Astrocystis sublimbata]